MDGRVAAMTHSSSSTFRNRPGSCGAGLLATLLLIFGAGCNGTVADPRVTKIQQLEDRIAEQTRQLQKKDEEIAQQSRMIQELRVLNGEERLARLVRVDRIELERLSGGYDENRDGVDDGVVAYLRLRDEDGDTIKAAGSVVLEAYDLAAPQSEQLVARAELDADAVQAAWFGRFMTSHYTIKAPWIDGRVPAHRRITISVRFTELLTGRTFETQHVGEVHLPPA